MLRGFLARLKKVLRGQRGYSLVEVTAVVAIAGVLTAVVLPEAIKKIEDSRIVSALGDVQTIATAVNAYFSDTGEFPTRALSTTTGLNTRVYLVSTDPDTGKAVRPDLTGNTGLTQPTTNADGSTDGSGTVGTITDYFVKRPTGITKWNGSYLSTDKLDPWQNSYVVYVEPLHKIAGSGTAKIAFSRKTAWVVSAGPNKNLETPLNTQGSTDQGGQIVLAGDDIGVRIFSDIDPELLTGTTTP